MRLSWLGESTITVLNGSGQDRHKTNASSCVLRIEYRGYTIILAGDIGQDRERDLVKYWRGGAVCGHLESSPITAVKHLLRGHG